MVLVLKSKALSIVVKEMYKKVSLRSADVFPVVASLPPKNNVCEPEQQNDFRDVNLLFWCWPIRKKDRNTAQVPPRDLAH